MREIQMRSVTEPTTQVVVRAQRAVEHRERQLTQPTEVGTPNSLAISITFCGAVPWN